MSPRNPQLNELARASANEAILNAAEEVISRDGLHGARTDEVARVAGVSKGLVFNYYKTKDELFEAVVRRQLERTFAVWETNPPQGHGRERLASIASTAIDHVVQHLPAFRLLLSLMLQPGASSLVQRAAMSMKSKVQPYYAMLHETFEELGSSDPATDALLFQAAINGVAQQIALQPELLKSPKHFPLDLLRERLVDAFLPKKRQRVSKAPLRSRKSPRRSK
jgi:AcrR family transcriptional regulator